MASSLPRVVVFDRIDANRRATALLSGICGLAMIPVVAALSFYLTGLVEVFLGGLMQVVGPEPTFRTVITTYIVSMVAIAVVLVTAVLYLQYRYADRIALRMSRARPLGRDREKVLWNTVEGLCVGTGLPLPKLYLVETEAPNAFSVGRTPADSSVVVTRGLLSLLTPRELEGVLAHEISHIGNQDIRLSTTVAAMGAILRLPFRLLTAPFRFLFHVHWILGSGALLLFGHILLYIPFFALSDFGESLRFSDEVDPTGNLRTLMLVGTGVFLYSFLVAPLIGFLFPLAISRQRELLADADAARLTLDPPSLARALAKITGGASGPMKGSHAMGHLYIVEPPGGGQWWRGIFPTHPPVRERIELLVGMGDGLPPEVVKGREPEGSALPRDFHTSPGESPWESLVSDREPGVGILDAVLYGIAVGTVAIAVLTLVNCLFLFLGAGNYRTGMSMPFHPPGALAAGFSARKGGTSGIHALGFALLVFMFSYVFLAPVIPVQPEATPDPLRWILRSLVCDIAVVAMAASAGASLDRWGDWVKELRGWVKELLGN